MWWVGRSATDIYLGTRAAGVSAADGTADFGSVTSLDDALEYAARRLVHPNRRSRPRVWLSGGLCPAFMLPKVQGVAGRNERRQVERALANERTLLGEDCQIWLHPDSSAAGRLGVAVGGDLPQKITAALGRVASIRPWWSEVLRAQIALKTGAIEMLGVRDCDSLTVLIGNTDGFESADVIRPLHIHSVANSTWLRARSQSAKSAESSRYARLQWQGPVERALVGAALGQYVECVE